MLNNINITTKNNKKTTFKVVFLLYAIEDNGYRRYWLFVDRILSARAAELGGSHADGAREDTDKI